MGLSLIFPYYENPITLRYQMSLWNSYPADCLDKLEIIVVDDGSRYELSAPTGMADGPLPSCRFQLLRIMVSLPWNVGGARNLGAMAATKDWICYVDIDHVVTEELLRHILAGEDSRPRDRFYRFERRSHLDHEFKHPHKECRLATKALYWALGGHDECYCGSYTASDGEFSRRVETLGNEEIIPVPLEYIKREQIADAVTTGLSRQRDPLFSQGVEAWKRDNGIGIRTLSLPWERII